MRKLTITGAIILSLMLLLTHAAITLVLAFAPVLAAGPLEGDVSSLDRDRDGGTHLVDERVAVGRGLASEPAEVQGELPERETNIIMKANVPVWVWVYGIGGATMIITGASVLVVGLSKGGRLRESD